MLASESTRDPTRVFGHKLAFARALPADARLRLLERRRGQLVQRLATARGPARAGRERLDSYTRSLREHSRETTEREISWLDRLIATERRDQQPAPVSGTGAPKEDRP